MRDVPDNPDQLAEQALSRLHEGDMEGARDICLRLLAAHPQHIVGLQAMALAAMRSNRIDEAIVHYGRLASIQPQPGAYIVLAECLWRAGRVAEALEAADAALAIDPSQSGGHVVRSAALHGLGRYEEAIDAAVEARRLDPASHVACARAGASLERMGRFDEAARQFGHASRLGGDAKPYGAVSFDRALYDRLALPRVPEMLQAVTRPREVAPADRRYVVLVCCDATYLRKYGFNFVHSFEANAAGGNLLHLHVVDPTSDTAAMLEKIGAELHPANLTVTVSGSPAGIRSGVARNVYYSCSRFLLLPQFVAKYAIPIVCMDIDAIVEGSLDGVVDWASRFDVTFVRREPPHSPWLDVSAGIVAAAPSARSRGYFERVRNYLLDFMDRGIAPWHIDQAALYCVYRMMGRFDAPPDVGWLPQAVRDRVWQIGHSHDRNLLAPRFTRYSPAAGARN